MCFKVGRCSCLSVWKTKLGLFNLKGFLHWTLHIKGCACTKREIYRQRPSLIDQAAFFFDELGVAMQQLYFLMLQL